MTNIIPTPGSVVETYVKVIDRRRTFTVKDVFLNRDAHHILSYINDDGEESYINVSHVVKIISASKIIPKRINYFRERSEVIRGEEKYLSRGSNYVGPLRSIISLCLAKLSTEVSGPIDYDKLKELFDKSRPGLVKCHNVDYPFDIALPIVNKKKIQKWVAKNYYKFLMKKSDWRRIVKQEQKREEEEYYKDLDDGVFDDLLFN